MKKVETILENPVMKVSVKETLLAIPIGKTVVIKNSTIKTSIVRGMINYMKPNGYRFKISEAGRIDDVLVTRIK
jgi:hypothetical protein